MFNEEKRFPSEAFLNYTSNHEVDFLLVNDGSTDDTQNLITDLSYKKANFSVLKIDKNVGKAEAVRQGVLKAFENSNYKAIGYFDADLATPLNEIDRLIETFSQTNKPFILGSRIKRLGTNIKRFKKRHFGGRIIATIISEQVLKLPVYDTQCGAKLLDRTIIPELFFEPFSSKWLFDVELIARLRNNRDKQYCLENIHEMSLLNWEDKGNSKITFRDLIKIPFDLIRLRNKYN